MDPQARRHRCHHRAQGFPGLQAPRALHVQRQVPVPEPEPDLPAERLQGLQEVPALIAPPPAELGVGKTCQRVERGVEVRADQEAEVLEVIARVDDQA